MHFSAFCFQLLKSLTQITQIFTNQFVLICVICVDKLSFTNLADFQSANQTYGLQVHSGLVRSITFVLLRMCSPACLPAGRLSALRGGLLPPAGRQVGAIKEILHFSVVLSFPRRRETKYIVFVSQMDFRLSGKDTKGLPYC